MACLKGLVEFVLTHVRLTLQADVLFDGNEIEITILMRIEVSGLIGGRTPSHTPRAQLVGNPQPRHVHTPTLCVLSSYCARFSGSLNPRAPGPIIGVLGPRPAALSSALYPSGTMVWVWLGPR